MPYTSMTDAVRDLEKESRLLRISEPVDPNLVLAEIHRRVFDAGGPALLFDNVQGTRYPVLTNLFGTFERTEFIFRDTIHRVKKAIEVSADPVRAIKRPFSHLGLAGTVLNALPRKHQGGLSRFESIRIDQLPLIVSWPRDGGAFITMPQVLTLPPDDRNIMHSNLGMYRIQLSGNAYALNDEVGMHYQLHRGIGVHHQMHNTAGKPFRASIFVGGLPAHSFSAIMPMPEGMTELMMAGMLSGRRFRYAWDNGHVISTDADFVITGVIEAHKTKPEGPFGDHLGYYSLEHPFPVLRVEKVYARKDAVWHATVVGRPPQEDSSFGYLIHELVGPMARKTFPGLIDVHAVDAAGVHPLLLAIGSERYMPFRERKPEEILTIANHLLGNGQTSLAKYLIIAAEGDDPALDIHDIPAFLQHVLKRIDLARDLHFQTRTTIDTLDYSGSGWNAGSKVVIAACGPVLRTLATHVPQVSFPGGFSEPRLVMPGVIAISGPVFRDHEHAGREIRELAAILNNREMEGIPLVTVTDNSAFTAETLNNFLWETFTRSNPSHDIYGGGEKIEFKHWGCEGPLIIDARSKPHHAPTLETDPAASAEAERIIQVTPQLKRLGI